MTKENCYIWVDNNLPENDRKFNFFCEKCHEKNKLGWFWEGSRLGYGPFDFTCDQCGHIIYIKPERIDD